MKRLHAVLAAVFCTLLLVSCTKRPEQKEIILGTETVGVMMPVGKEVVHPIHGKEVWFAVGAMNGEGETLANGVAQSHVFADNASIVTVNLNIHPASKGSSFVAWVSKSGSKEKVRLDRLQNPLNDVRHVITVDLPKDLREYTNVIVTLEHDSGPSETDPVQATGTLVVRKR